MSGDDVYRTLSMGGGGYGDPIERDPSAVLDDVERMLVSPEWAERVYGVSIKDGAVDAAATQARRDAIREERRAAADPPAAPDRGHDAGAWDAERDGVRLGEALFYDLSGEEPVYRTRCGYVLGPASQPWQELVPIARFPVQRIGPEVNPYHLNEGRFELRELYCPGTFTLLGIEIARTDDPLLHDASLTLEGENGA
jgi:N-methylhydantoinase B